MLWQIEVNLCKFFHIEFNFVKLWPANLHRWPIASQLADLWGDGELESPRWRKLFSLTSVRVLTAPQKRNVCFIAVLMLDNCVLVMVIKNQFTIWFANSIETEVSGANTSEWTYRLVSDQLYFTSLITVLGLNSREKMEGITWLTKACKLG